MNSDNQYTLIDCIDNVNDAESIVIDGDRALDVGPYENAYVKSYPDGAHAICFATDDDTELHTMSDLRIANMLRLHYIQFNRVGYLYNIANPVLVLPYGTSPDIAGFQYVYDIDLLNALTRGGNFVIARENSLIIYESNQLRTLPYGFNWFIGQVKQICGNANRRLARSLRFLVQRLCDNENFASFDNPYVQILMNKYMYGDGDVKYTIHELVRMIYGNILRNNNYVLYGWLAPFNDFGTSLARYVSRISVPSIQDLIITDLPFEQNSKDKVLLQAITNPVA